VRKRTTDGAEGEEDAVEDADMEDAIVEDAMEDADRSRRVA